MRRLHPISVSITLLGLLLINSTRGVAQNGPSQGKPSPISNEKIYNQVLEILFPIKEIRTTGIDFALFLRFRPSFEAESLVTIVKRGKIVEITETLSLDGNVFQKLARLSDHAVEMSPAELAKLIRLRTRVVDVPPLLSKRWFDDFSRSVCISLNPVGKASDYGLFLDGTFYEFRYISNTEEMNYIIYGPEVNFTVEGDNPPLIIWMNNIWQSIRASRNANKIS